MSQLLQSKQHQLANKINLYFQPKLKEPLEQAKSLSNLSPTIKLNLVVKLLVEIPQIYLTLELQISLY